MWYSPIHIIHYDFYCCEGTWSIKEGKRDSKKTFFRESRLQPVTTNHSAFSLFHRMLLQISTGEIQKQIFIWIYQCFIWIRCGAVALEVEIVSAANKLLRSRREIKILSMNEKKVFLLKIYCKIETKEVGIVHQCCQLCVCDFKKINSPVMPP